MNMKTEAVKNTRDMLRRKNMKSRRTSLESGVMITSLETPIIANSKKKHDLFSSVKHGPSDQITA